MSDPDSYQNSIAEVNTIRLRLLSKLRQEQSPLTDRDILRILRDWPQLRRRVETLEETVENLTEQIAVLKAVKETLTARAAADTLHLSEDVDEARTVARDIIQLLMTGSWEGRQEQRAIEIAGRISRSLNLKDSR